MAPKDHDHPKGHGPKHGPHGPKHSAPGPKHRPPHGPKHGRGATVGFIDADVIDDQLSTLIPDKRDRALVVRCVLNEGPAHHRGANAILLQLLGQLTQATPAADDESIAVPMRLPPHLQRRADDDDDDGPAVYPVRLPRAPLAELCGGDEATIAAMADCLLDGPPQHALANVVMVCLIDALRQTRREQTP